MRIAGFLRKTSWEGGGDGFRPMLATPDGGRLSIAAMGVADQAVQIHGGYGLMKEFFVEKYYRNSKLMEIGEGTSEVQKIVTARPTGVKGGDWWPEVTHQ